MSEKKDLFERPARDTQEPESVLRHTDEQEARGRVQTRTPLFASVKEWLGERIDADMLSFRRIGEMMDSGLSARISPGAWAAILSAAVLLMLALWREMAALLRPAGFGSVLFSLLGTLLCVLLPAVLGMIALRMPFARRRPLSAEQRLSLFMTGAASVCPIALLSDLPAALLARFGAETAAQAASALPVHLFLPMALASGVIAPVCEELFFRGCLLGALRDRGAGAAAAVSALVFAAAHGMDQFAARAMLGLLLAAVVLRTDSLAAGMIVHGMYNLTILLISFSGLSGLFSGLTLLSCAVRMAGTALFIAGLLRLWRARRMEMTDKRPELKLRRRDALRIAAAAAVLIVSQIAAGVMNG